MGCGVCTRKTSTKKQMKSFSDLKLACPLKKDNVSIHLETKNIYSLEDTFEMYMIQTIGTGLGYVSSRLKCHQMVIRGHV